MDCPFEFDECGMEIDDSKNGENSHPNISNADDTIRKRVQDLRGKAFRFSGTFTRWTFSENSQQARINEVNRKIAERLIATKQAHDSLNSITYVVLSYEISTLSSSAETCDIPVIGYISKSGDFSFRPRGGPAGAVWGVPPIRATYQCAHLLFPKPFRAVTAWRERWLARSESGR